MPGDESYFLLTTFANMAMARGYKDYDFVRTTTIDLFQVCYYNTFIKHVNKYLSVKCKVK